MDVIIGFQKCSFYSSDHTRMKQSHRTYFGGVKCFVHHIMVTVMVRGM